MTDLIPRELLFGNPRHVSPELSPDGLRMAYIAPDDGVLNVWVRTVGEEDDRPVTNDRGRGIREYSWAEDDVHILYVQDKDGDENWHLYRIPAKGGDSLDLTPFDGVQARLMGLERGHPGTILVGMNDRDPQFHDVHRVDLSTGERTIEVANDLGAVGFLADHDLNVRVAQLPTEDGGFRFLYREGRGAEWREILRTASEDALGTGPIGFSGDGRAIYFSSSVGSNAAELRRLDPATGEEEVLASDPVADLADVLTHPETHEPLAAVFTKERRAWTVLDESIRADLEALSGLEDGDVHVVDQDRTNRNWLVAHVRDRGPTQYHSYDRQEGAATFLFSARPDLDGAPLSEMRPVSFTARDGMEIPGYLTLPRNGSGKGLPAVVNVHGGPWHRDEWGYDPEAQWLANRGYACLQINFRGSTGYGKEHLNAGDREWGGKMQDDVTDGARWMIDEGIADPKRLGIYGGSYGGYAVLSGLTKTPDLFKCGVDIVGPSNLLSFIRTIPPYWEPLKAIFRKRVGDIETEEEFLKSRSPLFAVDRITAPLLIVQGKNDPRVNREESLQIKAALEAAGKTVEFLEFEDEGHGFARPENRLHHYKVAERFLAEHLGGRFEE